MAEGTYVVVVDRVSTESMAFAAKADTAGRAARNGRREVAASAASPSPRHLARHPFRVDLGADRLAIRCDPNVWITLKELCAAVLIMTTAALSSVGSGVTTFPFRFDAFNPEAKTRNVTWKLPVPLGSAPADHDRAATTIAGVCVSPGLGSPRVIGRCSGGRAALRSLLPGRRRNRAKSCVVASAPSGDGSMNVSSSTGRALTIQSHVVSGYVGNKCAVFPLQLHGFDVDPIFSVQFSNHTGYGCWKGEVMTGEQLQSLVEGLEQNGLLEGYTHLLTGYIGSASMLRTVARLVRKLRTYNPDLVYVCDPVLGDNGRLYVPAELTTIYREEIVPLATLLTPNQFEAELLTGMTIGSEEDALAACASLHQAGPPSVVLTSLDLDHSASSSSTITLLGSTSQPQAERCGQRFRIVVPRIPSYFTGTGDLCAALLLAWTAKMPDKLGCAAEMAVASLQGVLRRTAAAQAVAEAAGKTGIGCRELRLVNSVDELLHPKVSEEVTWL